MSTIHDPLDPSRTTTTRVTPADAECDSGRTTVDVRGPRFTALVTAVVLGLALLAIPSALATALVAVQTVVFALGTLVGLQAQPYGVLFRRVVRPRLGPTTAVEDAAPPRFAQGVGLAFAVVALLALVAGAATVAAVALGAALAASFLNAAFGFCLGCEVYLLGRRVLSR